MPIYEYQCKSCFRDFEEIVQGDESPECPHCHSANTEKLISRPCACRSSSDGYSAAGAGGGSCGCGGCSGGSCATCH